MFKVGVVKVGPVDISAPAESYQRTVFEELAVKVPDWPGQIVISFAVGALSNWTWTVLVIVSDPKVLITINWTVKVPDVV